MLPGVPVLVSSADAEPTHRTASDRATVVPVVGVQPAVSTSKDGLVTRLVAVAVACEAVPPEPRQSPVAGIGKLSIGESGSVCPSQVTGHVENRSRSPPPQPGIRVAHGGWSADESHVSPASRPPAVRAMAIAETAMVRD